jgi:hypothetical protein
MVAGKYSPPLLGVETGKNKEESLDSFDVERRRNLRATKKIVGK